MSDETFAEGAFDEGATDVACRKPSPASAVMRVNGITQPFTSGSGATLLEWLREDLSLISAKPACDEGVCGACAVMVDGQPVKACTMRVGMLNGAEVTTLEGCEHAHDETTSVITATFAEPSVFQCGYCKPAFVFAAVALLKRNPRPTRDEIRAAFDGLLCRCTGYQTIVDAVQKAATALVQSQATFEQEPPEVHAPTSLDAARALADHVPGARWIAGGQRLAQDDGTDLNGRVRLISLRQVEALRRIEHQGALVAIGAGCTHASIAASTVVVAELPGFAELAAQIGDVYVRASGTIGGAIASAPEGGCYPPFLLAAGASVTTTLRRTDFANWRRWTPAAHAQGQGPGELITGIEIPRLRHAASQAFRPRPGRLPLISISVLQSLEGELRIGVSGYARQTLLLDDAQALMHAFAMRSKDFGPLTAEPPIDDAIASAAYRTAILRKLLEACLSRAAAWTPSSPSRGRARHLTTGIHATSSHRQPR